ncbi:MAG: DEAD/DEAH box helicase [Thermomicrobiales bacterium]
MTSFLRSLTQPGRSLGPFLSPELPGGGAALLERPGTIEETMTDTIDQPTTSTTTTAVAPEADEATGISFADLGLSGALLESIEAVGYTKPSPIQERTIPVLLAGGDVIAQAQTGSGKTAAFGLPIIETIDRKARGVQALVLCPTRELAIQVSEALEGYGKHKRVETLAIYGGQPYERQIRGLQRGVQIVVGTPGRVMDHMRRGTLTLDNLKFFVLDEADEMLDMGFVDDIEWVLQHVPEERQTALFSATMPPRIAELANNYMNDAQRISVRGKQMTVAEIRQTSYEIPRGRKLDALARILEAETPSSAIIFCRTKHGVDELGEGLMQRGFAVETLHGDLSQAQRDRVMKRFRAGQADILIATDVAARGLDIPDVSHVINYDLPESPETYVHRIGRTGRAGKSGEAISLVGPRDIRWIRQLERITKATVEPRRLPTAADVNTRRREVLKNLVSKEVENESDYEGYTETVTQLFEQFDPQNVAAALLKLYAEETGRSTTELSSADDFASYEPRDRGERPVGERRPVPAAADGMTRLFINIGRTLRVRPQDIVGAIANEAGVPGRAIGAIDIHDTYTFVDVPTDAAQRVIEVLSASSIKGRPVNVEVASSPAGTRERAPRSGGGSYDRGPRREGGSGGYRGGNSGYRGASSGGYRSGGGYDRGPRRDDRAGGSSSYDRGPRRDYNS